jgi:predicted phage terminase large subunit-like protein
MLSRPDDASAVILRDLEAVWAAQEARERWAAVARPEQLAPIGDWLVWLVLAGRGWGKTRTGAEDVSAFALGNPGARIALVGPTAADVRDVMIEGQSGLRSVLPRGAEDVWNRSLGELVLNNGARFKAFSAEEPERLRGPQHHRAWCDELGAWKNAQATWDQLQFTLRLGANPRAVVTTTPKPTPLLRALLAAATTHVTRGSTFDNEANLAPAALAAFRARYEGTRLGRQELYAELLTDTPGALWTRDMIEAARCDETPPMARVVVAVDPSGSDGTSGDRQGIVVAGLGRDGRGYVLEDASMRGSPDQWARTVARLYHLHGADRVVAEANFGGAMVEAVLRSSAPNLPVKLVSASRGKVLRAEPVAALYEQGRISHVGAFPALEDQMAEMTTGGFVGQGSPDAVDALVWALTDLMLAPGIGGWLDHMRERAAVATGALPVAVPMVEAPPAKAPVLDPKPETRLVALRTGTPGGHYVGRARYTPDDAGLVHVDPQHVPALIRAGCTFPNGELA